MSPISRHLKILICLVICCCLSACHSTVATDQSNGTAPSWAARQQALKHLNNWTIKGAFSVQTPKKNIIGSYHWNQQGPTYQITLLSPMGALSVTITGTPGHVALWRGYKPETATSTPEQLLTEYVGWSLPISDLLYWIRGLPAPGASRMTFTTNNEINTLDQDGWHITFSDYVNVSTHLSLPRTLQLYRRDFTSKITVKRWDIRR